jgi:SsrA-binding protein
MASTDTQVVATNRQARRNYELSDTYECGIVLLGSEVKSLRESKVQLTESYAAIEGGEVWLHGLHIAPYSHAQAHSGHEPVRPRKLLLHRQQIERLRHRLQTERLTLVPLRLYFSGGRAKVEIAVGKGKRTVDKRQDIARRDADREAARAVARGRRGEG